MKVTSMLLGIVTLGAMSAQACHGINTQCGNPGATDCSCGPHKFIIRCNAETNTWHKFKKCHAGHHCLNKKCVKGNFGGGDDVDVDVDDE